MRAITLWQPYATLLVAGIKIHETRSWSTNYRGELLIHAAKRPIKWAELDIESLEKIHPRIKDIEYPLGAIVGKVEIVDCRPIGVWDLIEEVDEILGDWTEGRFAWECANPQPLLIPDVKGKQGFWQYEIEDKRWTENS